MTITNRIVSIALLVIAVIGIAFLSGRHSVNNGDKLAQFDKQFKTYQETTITPQLKKNDSLIKLVSDSKKSIDSLTKLSKTKDSQIGKLQNSIVSMNTKKFTDSITKVAPPDCSLAIHSLDSAFASREDSLNKELSLYASKNSNMASKDSILTINQDILLHQNDSLRVVILHVPTPPKSDNKFLGFIPKPTRIESFFLGIIAAATADILIKK